jgi:hypothetical protein
VPKKDKPNTNNNDINKDNELALEPREEKILTETANELGLDLENSSDLLQPPSMPEDLTPEALEELVNDPKTKTLVREVNKNPNIMDTLPKTTIIGEISEQEAAKIREKRIQRRSNLILQLAANDTVKLHINVGMKDGKIVWVEKEYWMNSFDKKQELSLNILNARLKHIQAKYSILINKPASELSEADQNFVMNAQLMVEIAAYRVQEYEVFIKFGMHYEDYARVQTEELNLAREIFNEHIRNVPSYSRGR